MRTPAKIELGIKCCASTNIDKCTGCPYEGFSGRTGCRTQLFKDTQDYLKAIRKSAARIETMVKQIESAQPKWISVEDELPPVGEKVLVCANNVRLMAFIDCEDVWHRDTITYRLPGEVTHWMPLPSAPKEEV